YFSSSVRSLSCSSSASARRFSAAVTLVSAQITPPTVSARTMATARNSQERVRLAARRWWTSGGRRLTPGRMGSSVLVAGVFTLRHRLLERWHLLLVVGHQTVCCFSYLFWRDLWAQMGLRAWPVGALRMTGIGQNR